MRKKFLLFCLCALCLAACSTAPKTPGRVGQMYFATVTFGLNGNEIALPSYKTIDEAVKVYKKDPSVTLQVRGYADASGSEQVNLRLSQQRADTVAKALQIRGVPVQHIRAKGYGAQKPVASNNTPEGRAQNRRVEIEFPYPQKSL